MSTWTSSRGLLAVVPAMLLAACAGGPDVMRLAGGAVRMPPETVAVAGRSVVIGGPRGYCVDRGASRLGGDTAFVLLGSCALIADNPEAGAPDTAGVLTASVDRETGSGPAIGAAIDQIARFLTTPQGRAALARDGQAGSVEVLDSALEDGALFIHLRDTSVDVIPGAAEDYWRGLFDVNGHLVTVSVIGFADRPMSRDAGLQTLRGFHDRIVTESRENPPEGRPVRPRMFGNLFN